MRVEAGDLEHASRGQKGLFEEFIHSLIQAAGAVCGIRSNDIDWDPRTDVPDGGRDIVVRVGNPLGTGHFIPDRPSIWSVKSGADGIQPSALKREVLPPPPEGKKWPDHPKIRESLARQEVFVWCAAHPVSNDQQDKMREAGAEVARQLGVSPDRIQLWFQEQLAAAANGFPCVILTLPAVRKRWEKVYTLPEWHRLPNLGNPWAEFGERARLVDRVAAHLLGRDDPCVLHVAGLSGVGKTRTVLEACHRNDQLRDVLYLARPSDLDLHLVRHLREAQRVSVVIDETPLDQIDAVAAPLRGLRRPRPDRDDRPRQPAAGRRAPGHRGRP